MANEDLQEEKRILEQKIRELKICIEKITSALNSLPSLDYVLSSFSKASNICKVFKNALTQLPLNDPQSFEGIDKKAFDTLRDVQRKLTELKAIAK